MQMNGKLCVFSSFLIGAAAGYFYHDYKSSRRKYGKKEDVEIVFPVPKCMARKAKKLKKDMQGLWDDMH